MHNQINKKIKNQKLKTNHVSAEVTKEEGI